MSYTITCPYCFKTMLDDEVHFRSERVSREEADFIPAGFDVYDLEEYKRTGIGPVKESVIQKWEEWEFFRPQGDPAYEAFWEPFGGTTEVNPADMSFGVKAYERKVIDPTDPAHQRYLRRQPDGSYFVREEGMVVAVDLANGRQCRRRVCRHCHNPLQDKYGGNETKFIAVIGMTGSGKTVYLSQLLKGIDTYVAKAGWTVWQLTPSIRVFMDHNPIRAQQPLPDATPKGSLQQPLIFAMDKGVSAKERETKTFVLYDVAGEAFTSPHLVDSFAPFVKHADGAIVLLDPKQFGCFGDAHDMEYAMDSPMNIIQAFRYAVNGDSPKKCGIPLAVCLSKADSALPWDLARLLRETIGRSNGFNAVQYAPLARGLDAFFRSEQVDFSLALENSFSAYSYFAFSALGCDVQTTTDQRGGLMSVPVGPIFPRRIEEPLLWLLYRFGFIGRNGDIPGEAYCPKCDSPRIEYLGRGVEKVVRKGPLGILRKKEAINMRCLACGEEWYQEPEQ